MTLSLWYREPWPYTLWYGVTRPEALGIVGRNEHLRREGWYLVLEGRGEREVFEALPSFGGIDRGAGAGVHSNET